MGAAIVEERGATAPSWSQVDEFTTSLQVKIPALSGVQLQ